MKSFGWTMPRLGRRQRISASRPVGHHVVAGRTSAGRRGRTPRASSALAQVHLQFHAPLDHVLHAGLEHDVPVLALPALPGASRCPRRATAPRRWRAAPVAMPMLGGDGELVRRRSGTARSSASCSRSAISSAPPTARRLRRSPRTRRRRGARARRCRGRRRRAARAIARSSSSPAPWPSVSLMRREVVEVDEQRRHGSALRGARARSICSRAVEDQRAVGQAGELIVRGHERELLAGGWSSSSSVRIARPRSTSHIRTSVTSSVVCVIAQRLRAAPLGGMPSRSAAARAAPRSTASRQRRQRLVTSSQRRGAVRGQLAEHLPRFSPRLQARLRRPPRHQSATVTVAMHADAREAARAPRPSSSPCCALAAYRDALEHSPARVAQRLAETAELRVGVLGVGERCPGHWPHSPPALELILHLAAEVGNPRASLELADALVLRVEGHSCASASLREQSSASAVSLRVLKQRRSAPAR